MTFISLQYVLFLLVLLAAYWSVPLQWWRLYIMLIGSLIFYASLQIWYIPLLLVSILFNYFLAMAIGNLWIGGLLMLLGTATVCGCCGSELR